MIDLTPLDIRKKKGDFSRQMRGYDPEEVDHFLDMVAERLEEVVKTNLTLEERVDRLSERVQGQEGRERAVQEALVTAQSLKHDIQEQAKREADLIKREAESAAHSVRDEINRILQERRRELVELNRARSRFLKSFRNLLERELDSLEVEEASPPSDDFDLEGAPVETSGDPGVEPVPFRLSLGRWRKGQQESDEREDPEDAEPRELEAHRDSADERELEAHVDRKFDQYERGGSDEEADAGDPDDDSETSLELVPDGEREGEDANEEAEDSDEGRWGRNK